MDEGIDFVVLWVDGNDPAKSEMLKKLQPKTGYAKCRSREWGTLRYFFRSIETYAPWFRKIHFVTSCKTPDWLDTENPKLNLVSEEEIFPLASDLPTFNSCAVQSNLHNIKGLSEKFVLFDDDFFILRNTSPTRFFRDGLPVDSIIFHTHRKLPADSPVWNMSVEYSQDKVERHFKLKLIDVFKYPIVHLNYDHQFNAENLKSVIKYMLNRKKGLFSLMTVLHVPQGLLKRNLIEAHEIFKEEFAITSSNHFRTKEDMVWSVYRYINLLKKEFYPFHDRDEISHISVKNLPNLTKQYRVMRRDSNPRFVCFNDVVHNSTSDEELKLIQDWLLDTMQRLYPNKSSFER